MSKLQILIKTFKNDTHWNTQNNNGTYRFDKEILWIEEMIKSYSEKLGIPIDDIVDLIESQRTYSWPNYYQEANFPKLDSKNLIGVYKTFEEFRGYVEEHYEGFKCPNCGTVGQDPQECTHRIKKDGVCDWCSYGLFSSGISVIILESGIKPIPIFEPIEKEK